MYKLSQLEQLLQAKGIAKGYQADKPYYLWLNQLTETEINSAAVGQSMAYLLMAGPLVEAVVLHTSADTVKGWYLTSTRALDPILPLYQRYPNLQLTLQPIQPNASYDIVFIECLAQLLQHGELSIIDVQQSLRQHAIQLLTPELIAGLKRLWKYRQLQQAPQLLAIKEVVYAYEPSLDEAIDYIPSQALWQLVNQPAQLQAYCEHKIRALKQWRHWFTGYRLLYLVYESTYAPLGQLFAEAAGLNLCYLKPSAMLLGLAYSANLGLWVLGQSFILQLISFISLPYRLDDAQAQVKLGTATVMRLGLILFTLGLAYTQQTVHPLYSLLAGLTGSLLVNSWQKKSLQTSIEQQALRQLLALLGWQLGQSSMSHALSYFQAAGECEIAKTRLIEGLAEQQNHVSTATCWTPLLWGRPKLLATYTNPYQAVQLECQVDNSLATCEVVNTFRLLSG